MVQASIELNELDLGRPGAMTQQEIAANNISQLQTSSSEFSLPPVDTGKEAWLFLTACWIVEAFVFGEPLLSPVRISLAHEKPPGFGFSFGIYQDFYSTHKPFAGSGSIAVIGTTTMVGIPDKKDDLFRRD